MSAKKCHFYKSAKQKNIGQRDDLQGRVDQYEEDRIGKGLVGGSLGVGGPTNPSTIKTKPILPE
jgi:hypothetical protein